MRMHEAGDALCRTGQALCETLLDERVCRRLEEIPRAPCARCGAVGETRRKPLRGPMARGADKACYCERCLLSEEGGFVQQQVHEPEAFGSHEWEVQAGAAAGEQQEDECQASAQAPLQEEQQEQEQEREQQQEEEQEHASRIAEVEPSRPCAHSQEHERMTVAQVTAACVQTLLHWHLCRRYWGIPDRSCENPHRWWCSDLSTWCEAFASEACGLETGEKQVNQKVLDSQACVAGAEPERELEQEQESVSYTHLTLPTNREV